MSSCNMSFSPVRCMHTIFLFLAYSCLVYGSTAIRHLGPRVAMSQVIPSCALTCIDAFVKSQYITNTCSELSDLNCLCTTNTTSGFTFGEAALQCTISYCPSEVISNSDSIVYNICESVPGALPRTHSVMTATAYLAGGTTIPVMSTGVSSPSLTFYSTSTDFPAGYVPTGSSLLLSVPSTMTMTMITTADLPATMTASPSTDGDQSMLPSVTSSSSSTPSAGVLHSHSLSSGAVVGISVTTGVFACVVIGISVVYCIRKRGKGRRVMDQGFSETEGATSESHGSTRPPPRHPFSFHKPPASSNGASQETLNSKGPPFLASAHDSFAILTGQAADRSMKIEEATHPAFPARSGPETEASKLLSDPPMNELRPRPLRISRQGYPRPESELTVFEEDMQGRLSIPPNGLKGYASLLEINWPSAVGLPAHPRATKDQGRAARGLGVKSPSQQAKPVHPGPGGKPQAARVTSEADSWKKPLPRIPELDRNSGPATRSELADLNEGQRSRQDFESIPREQLSPGKEVPAPTGMQEIGNHFHSTTRMRFRPYHPDSINPSPNAISQTRSIQDDKIMRVRVGQGQQQPNERMTPFSPDDFWRISRDQPPQRNVEMQAILPFPLSSSNTPVSASDDGHFANHQAERRQSGLGLLTVRASKDYDYAQPANNHQNGYEMPFDGPYDRGSRARATTPTLSGLQSQEATRESPSSPLSRNLTPIWRGSDMIIAVD